MSLRSGFVNSPADVSRAIACEHGLDFAESGQGDVREPISLHRTVQRDAILPKRTAADNAGGAICHGYLDLLDEMFVIDAGRKHGPRDVAAELRYIRTGFACPWIWQFENF